MNPNDEYYDLVGATLGHESVTRRGMESRELLVALTRWDMEAPIISLTSRKLNYGFMFAEALWVLRGRTDVRELGQYCKSILSFSDDGRHLSGAYGPKFIEQQRYVVDKLKADPDTRQAVMTFWRPSPRDSLDIPCTLALHFIKMYGCLNVVAYMRSSDVWLGLPYDVFTFSMIGLHILLQTQLDLKLGVLSICATSQHLYERDVEKALAFCDDSHTTYGTQKSIGSYGVNSPDSLECLLESLRDNPKDIWA